MAAAAEPTLRLRLVVSQHTRGDVRSLRSLSSAQTSSRAAAATMSVRSCSSIVNRMASNECSSCPDIISQSDRSIEG